MDSRKLYDSFTELVSMPENRLYDGLLASIKDDPKGIIYQYNSMNEEDPVYKRWRPMVQNFFDNNPNFETKGVIKAETFIGKDKYGNDSDVMRKLDFLESHLKFFLAN